ncbi:nucleotidyltransferase [Companilactobacillus sp. HBUAS56275]|uniref:tRNA(Met) cytidine acetate ligase n=1 Tax=Candidatus Companilactobacillus pullicola TaxID=2838523 RepID=A0A9D1ZND1_9LACO|nr:nucleotidyltransferase [Candidatus Companilactobacillus pullicola]
MTKVYGFVAEFNPFHNGHKLFIDKIKQEYHPDVLIAVMSGNFVQRGDFAILDKWSRAKIAVENGVDLVIELPFAYAVEPAQYFAQGAIKLLHLLGVNELVFGTEQKLDFDDLAQKIMQADVEFQQDYRLSSADNLTQHYQALGIDISKLPNQLLGLNYVTQIAEQNYRMNVNTIQRLESDFSATEIRRRRAQNISFTDLVPEATYNAFETQRIVTWDDYFPYLKFQILSHSVGELQTNYQMVEGLEFKLKKEIEQSHNFTELVEHVKSKRYTMARIRRLMVYTLLNVKESDINNVYDNPYLRILGFDDVGKKYLNSLKKSDVDLITKVGKKEQKKLNLEIQVDDIRQLITEQEQNFGRIPYMKGVN